MYSITVDLTNKKCVVIGGGKIAYRKVNSLLEAGAVITVISPEICNEIRELELHSKISILKKEVEKIDYENAFLIIAATNSIKVNEEIAANVNECQLLNVVSNPNLGNFHVPASFSRGRLTISVSTGGASPHLAKQIRDDIKKEYDESYEEYLDFLFECRTIIKNNSNIGFKLKSELLKELLHQKYKYCEDERIHYLKKLHEWPCSSG